jgi:L-ascorbate metabolism protein UlaG (beta-lactamase superfamily)
MPIYQDAASPRGVVRSLYALFSTALICLAVLLQTAAAAAEVTETRRPVKITYLGNAGWQIDDGHKIILVDPFISEFRTSEQHEQVSGDDPIITPWAEGIDAHIRKADYILITHGHEDHMLDAPYIAKRTGAVIICHESAANIARAYGIGDSFTPSNVDVGKIKQQQLIVVRGGEDFQLDGFSLEVITSLHTALFDKRYNDGFWAGSTRPGLKAPLHESDYAEGGTLIYLLRIAGHRIFIMGSMNYIEREIDGLRPDVAIIGAGSDRKQIYNYAPRLMQALGDPPVVFPTHWDDYAIKPRAEALKGVNGFADEIRAASPQTKVIIPDYFAPITLP